jgi:hypothetical protein
MLCWGQSAGSTSPTASRPPPSKMGGTEVADKRKAVSQNATESTISHRICHDSPNPPCGGGEARRAGGCKFWEHAQAYTPRCFAAPPSQGGSKTFVLPVFYRVLDEVCGQRRGDLRLLSSLSSKGDPRPFQSVTYGVCRHRRSTHTPQFLCSQEQNFRGQENSSTICMHLIPLRRFSHNILCSSKFLCYSMGHEESMTTLYSVDANQGVGCWLVG